MQHEHHIGLFLCEQFQHWNEAPFHIGITVKNENWVTDEWFGELEGSCSSKRLVLSGVADTHRGLVCAIEVAFNFLGHIPRSQNHVTDALRHKPLEQQLEKRRARN